MKDYKKAIALVSWQVAKRNVNSACMWVLYQGKLPDGAKKLKK